MTDIPEQMAAEHVAQSLDELRDPDKRSRWIDGSRAKEQAEAIVARIIADALGRIEGRKPTDES